MRHSLLVYTPNTENRTESTESRRDINNAEHRCSACSPGKQSSEPNLEFRAWELFWVSLHVHARWQHARKGLYSALCVKKKYPASQCAHTTQWLNSAGPFSIRRSVLYEGRNQRVFWFQMMVCMCAWFHMMVCMRACESSFHLFTFAI